MDTETEPTFTSVSDLNDYVLNHIFTFLLHTDQLNCRLVSRRWNSFANSFLTFSHGRFTYEQLSLIGLSLAKAIPTWTLCLFHSSQVEEAIEIATKCGSSVRKLHFLEAPSVLPVYKLLPPPESLFPFLTKLSLSISSSCVENLTPSTSTWSTIQNLKSLSIERIDKSGIKFTIDIISIFPRLQEIQLDYKLSKTDTPSQFLSELADCIPRLRRLTTLRFTQLWGGSHSSYDPSDFFLKTDDFRNLTQIIRNVLTLELPSLWLTFEFVSHLQKKITRLDHLTSFTLRSVYFEYKPDRNCHRFPINNAGTSRSFFSNGVNKVLPFKEIDFFGFSLITPNLKTFRVVDENRAILKFHEETNSVHPIFNIRSELFPMLSSPANRHHNKSLHTMIFGTDCVLERNEFLNRIVSSFSNLYRLKISIGRGSYVCDPICNYQICGYDHQGGDDVTLENVLETLSLLLTLRILEITSWRPIGRNELSRNLLQVKLFKSLSYRLVWADEVLPFTRGHLGEIIFHDNYFYNQALALKELHKTHTIFLDGFSCKKANRTECRDVKECATFNKFLEFCQKSQIPVLRHELLWCPSTYKRTDRLLITKIQ